jgi:hypothetical protein
MHYTVRSLCKVLISTFMAALLDCDVYNNWIITSTCNQLCNQLQLLPAHVQKYSYTLHSFSFHKSPVNLRVVIIMQYALCTMHCVLCAVYILLEPLVCLAVLCKYDCGLFFTAFPAVIIMRCLYSSICAVHPFRAAGLSSFSIMRTRLRSLRHISCRRYYNALCSK